MKRGTLANLAPPPGTIRVVQPLCGADAVHGPRRSRSAGKRRPSRTVPVMPASHVVILLLGGLGAGVFNGVAGGGSLISFPILLGLGYPALTANITNTIGIWPGYVASAAGFRREIGDQSRRLLRLSPVALAGGVAGALLLLTTSSATFDDVVPWLVLGAGRAVRRPAGTAQGPGPGLRPPPDPARAAGGRGLRRLGLRRLLRRRHGRDVPRRPRPGPSPLAGPHQRAAGRPLHARQRHRRGRLPHPRRAGVGGGGPAGRRQPRRWLSPAPGWPSRSRPRRSASWSSSSASARRSSCWSERRHGGQSTANG